MVANGVFLNTNGWVALLNASDDRHADALVLWQSIVRAQRPIILTDWIIAETGNGLARTEARTIFPRAVAIAESSPRVSIVGVDAELRKRALELYSSRNDKSWGLVDCASFLVMQDRGITEAFTMDHHFDQSGFKALFSK